MSLETNCEGQKPNATTGGAKKTEPPAYLRAKVSSEERELFYKCLSQLKEKTCQDFLAEVIRETIATAERIIELNKLAVNRKCDGADFCQAMVIAPRDAKHPIRATPSWLHDAEKLALLCNHRLNELIDNLVRSIGNAPEKYPLITLSYDIRYAHMYDENHIIELAFVWLDQCVILLAVRRTALGTHPIPF